MPDIENEVALFEKKYPQIDVTVENVGQGLEHYQKVRTALQSSDGAPLTPSRTHSSRLPA